MGFWSKNNGAKKEPKTVNIFLGFFFVVNFCVGTGFLGVPYSFFYSGYLAAIPTMIFIGIVGWANANYLLEVMARAQALEYFDKFQNPSSDSETTDSELDQRSLSNSFLNGSPSTRSMTSHPKFEITVKRKFEIPELCDIFVSKYLKYIYLVLLSIYSFLASWSFSTVAATAWAINIPFQNFGATEECAQDAFLHNLLPSGGCLYAYYVSLTMFGVIVVTLSMLDLKEQAAVQLTLGVLRFITVAIIVIYCIVKLSEGGDACHEQNANETMPPYVRKESTVVKFDPSGWVLSIPVFSFAFLFHTGISSLTHPIRQKKHLHWLIVAMYVASTILYMSLGVVVPLWFLASIQEICTLNWAAFANSGHSIPIRILSYYIVLFPTLDVISAFPLQNHVIVNNIYILITGHDTSKKPKYRFDWLLRIFLRFSMAVLPILAAFGVSNLIYILKYGGLLGFIGYIFPVTLQLVSIYVCKKKFATSFISISNPLSIVKEKKPEMDDDGDDDDEEDEQSNSKKSLGGEKEKESLLEARDMSSKEKQALYMTPYSNMLISHPVSAWIVAVVVILLFIFGFSSLFINLNKLTCDSYY